MSTPPVAADIVPARVRAAGPAATEASWRRRLALALMVASGFAGLGYQVVWTQQCALWLGHESAAVLAVVAAFFGGLALGAFVAGPRIEHSAHPVRWYAACEALIALWGAVLVVAMAPASDWILARTGVEPSPDWQWSVAFAATLALLLPATAAMGATLPAIERIFAPSGRRGRSIDAYYAANTAGAVLGVLAVAFWLVPSFGLARTALVCVALNLLCAVAALVAMPSFDAATSRRDPRRSRRVRSTLVTLFCTGLLGIGYELLVVRVLSQVAEDTVYTFAILLAVYLGGTALGAAAHARWLAPRRRDSTKPQDRLLVALATACLLGAVALYGAEDMRAALLGHWGPGIAAAVAAEAALAVVAFALPTIAMGALFSALAGAAHEEGASFGRALAVNTLGAAIAPLVFGVLLAPLLGAKATLVAIALGYLVLATRTSWPAPAVWVTGAAAIAFAAVAPPLVFVDVPAGGRIVELREGVMAAVSVVEDAAGVARLRINNRQQEGSSATLFVDGRQALLPVLLHPGPRRALFLGLGTGVTARAAAEDPTLAVDAVELVPEVVEASRQFASSLPTGASRLHVISADARRYVRATDSRYDVIVADNFHPARSGSAALYTVEHFRAVRARLAGGGVFCQWLPLHQLDLPTLRSIVRSFIAVYPEARALLASNSLQTPVLGLVGREDGGRFDAQSLRHRLASSASPRRAAEFAIDDDLALVGGFIAGTRALAAFAGEAIANTDDRPVVAYLAPRLVYDDDADPASRLNELLGVFAIAPDELVAPTSDPAWSRRLAAYWSARDRFLQLGQRVRPTSDVRAMLAQVREPLLELLATSPDFRPAYDPLLRMAKALAPIDAPAARALLHELARRQPARAEAQEAMLLLAP